MNFEINTEQLTDFFSGMNATLTTAKSVRKAYDKGLALEFNPLLQIFSIGENKFSDIISYFLDPNQRHGQGNAFLKVFTKWLDLDDVIGKYDSALVEVEHVIFDTIIGRRRIDIYIVFNNGFRIGIENKIWNAPDQEEQLSDYNIYLAKKGKNYCLVYMPQFQKSPSSESICEELLNDLKGQGKYICKDHSLDTSRLIEEWIKVCQAEKVRLFLRDVHQFIQHKINQQSYMGDKEITADFLENNIHNLNAALAVPAALQELYSRLSSKITHQAKSLANELKIDFIGSNISYSEGLTGFTFSIEGTKNRKIWIRFEFETSGFTNYYYGILGSGEGMPRRLAVEGFLADKLGFGAINDYWSWWHWHENQNEPSAILKGVYNGQFIKDVEDKLNVLIPVVRELLNSDIPIED